MTAHPNRSRRPGAAGANPQPDEIVEARLAVNLTQTQAAALVYCTLRAWQDWEAGARRMHPATWDLWRARAGAPDAADDALRAGIRAIDRLARERARSDS